MIERIELFLLGPLRILCNGQPVTNDLPVKAQALLCYLAVTEEAHTRQALAGLLWGDAPEAKALGSLRVALNALRKFFPHHLTITHLTVALNSSDDCWADVAAFAKQMHSWMRVAAPTAADVAALRAALDGYRGDFLQGFFVEEAPEFEAWLLAQRAQWQHQALRGLQELAAWLLDERAYGEAIAVLTRWLAIEPWAEAAHRQLMLTHSRMRNFNAALAQYETCRVVLAQELGVEPMPETAALAARIQVARRTPPPPLPANPTSLVGRGTVLAQIQQWLAKPACRLITIVGLGGMGKTHLALAAAHQVNQEQALRFLHGVVFVALEGVETVDVLPHALAGALHLPLRSGGDAITQLLNYLRDKELLLVLDNFEQLLDGVVLLKQLLTTCPDLKLLVTSRVALNLATEWRIDLEGLAYPTQQVAIRPQSDVRESFAAVQLFLQTAQQVQPSFQLTPANTPAIHRLCQLVGGMPLALNLAATWLRVMSCEQIVAEVERSLDALSAPMRDVPPRQRNIRAIFDATRSLLTAEEARALGVLSIFRGGFTGEAARGVAGAPPTLVAGLVDCGLLQVERFDHAVRYRMHEVTRQYAAETVALSDQPSLQRRHADFYLTLAEAIEAGMTEPDRSLWLARLAQERDNFRTALHWLLRPESLSAKLPDEREVALRLGAALWSAWFWREGWQEGGEWLNRLLALADGEKATKGWVKTLRCAGMMAHFEGKLSTARTLLEESVTLARTMNDRQEWAYSWLGLGVTLRDLGSYLVAYQGLVESLTFLRSIDDTWGLFLVNNELGRIMISQGEYAATHEFFTASLAQARRLQDPWGMIYLLHNLLALAQVQHDDATARAHYAEILTIHSALDQHVPQMHPLQALTLSAYILGDVVAWSAHFVDDYATAVALFEEQLAVSRERGDEQLTAWLLNHLGDVIRLKEDNSQAMTLYQQSLAIFQRLALPAGVALVLHNLGYIHLARGNSSEAQAKFLESLRLYREGGIAWNQGDCLVGLAGVAYAQGEYERAAQLLGAAHALHAAVDVSGAYASPTIRRDTEQITVATREQCSPQAWKTAWTMGGQIVTQADDWLSALALPL